MIPQIQSSSRSEAALTRWGRLIVRHRWAAIAVPMLLTAFFVSYLPNLTLDNSTEAFLHPDDPATIRYRAFRDSFGRDDRIIIALAPEDAFSADFLKKLRRSRVGTPIRSVARSGWRIRYSSS